MSNNSNEFQSENSEMAEEIICFLRPYSLEYDEEVVRLIMKNCDVLQYNEELKKFYDVFKDKNYFRRTIIVSSSEFINILKGINQHPMITTFMKDYIEVRGDYEFSHHVTIFLEEMQMYAMYYVNLNDESKETEQEDWAKRYGFRFNIFKEENCN